MARKKYSMVMNKNIPITTQGQGLYEFTDKVNSLVSQLDVKSGICNLFLQHTSAGLIIQENADPSAKKDLETWLARLVKENDPLYTHIFEGADDMPSHIKSVLTGNTLTIPIIDGQLALGTWQGIYLWEFRSRAQKRNVIVSIL
jgi:secondary thiamine-phosphate synthase enzyme